MTLIKSTKHMVLMVVVAVALLVPLSPGTALACGEEENMCRAKLSIYQGQYTGSDGEDHVKFYFWYN